MAPSAASSGARVIGVFDTFFTDYTLKQISSISTCQKQTGLLRYLKAAFFLIFSTVKFMFECSDLSSYFFKHRHGRPHDFSSPRIIFRKPNGARQEELIF